MKRWKKLLLVLLVIVFLSQIPFAYRRYKLGRLHASIQQLNSERVVISTSDGLAEFKGVIHVHSFLGGHSTGTLDEIVSAAQANQLNFVIMTEHPSKDYNTADMTLRGVHGGVLFLGGNEIATATGDRLLLLPGDDQANADGQRATQEVLSRRTSGLSIVAYPNDFKHWEAGGYHGIEVYNVYTNARQINPLIMFFDGLWSYRSYPDLLFANFYRRPDASLKLWDELIKQKGQRYVATAGNDAHANVGLSLNDSSGKAWLGIKLDPYERSFGLVRMHVLVDDLSALNGQISLRTFDEKSLLGAVSAGHCFIGFDLFGDTSGFRFSATDADEKRIMGDEIKLDHEVTLSVSVPVRSRIVLLKDGVAVQETTGENRLNFTAKEQGSYRVEVYLSQLPDAVGQQPWIISNAIYVR